MASSSPAVTPNFNDYLKMVNNPDGSVTRLVNLPSNAASADHHLPVISKDVTINSHKNISVRIFLPRQAPDPTPPGGAPPTAKLPLIVYFHGGGFVICTAATTLFHNLCALLAAEVCAVVVSVDYRLAPEHRLPAAYEDGVEALNWIKTGGEDWVSEYADVSRCFLMGTSAGGNLAYFAGLRVVDSLADLEPLKIRGMILHHPFFGGVQRSGSEVRLENDGVLPLCATDLMWELALPEGVDRDHEYSNPMARKGSEHCSKIRDVGWKVLVTGCDGDLLHDGQVEFVDTLKRNGVEAKGEFEEGGHHVIELFQPSKAEAMFGFVKNFIA